MNSLQGQEASRTSATRIQFIGAEKRNHNLLTDCQPTPFGVRSQLLMDSQPNVFAGHSSSSVAFAPEGGEISPSFRSAPYRGMWDSNAHASMYSGDKDNDQNSHPSCFRGMIAPPLTSSNFVADVGQHPREIHSAHGDPDVFQRRGRVSLDNITQRDSKRPSERPRDRDYHRRFSVGLPQSRGSPHVLLGGNARPRTDSSSVQHARSAVAVDFEFSTMTPRHPNVFLYKLVLDDRAKENGEMELITSDSSVQAIPFNFWCGLRCPSLISSLMQGIFLVWIQREFHWCCSQQHHRL